MRTTVRPKKWYENQGLLVGAAALIGLAAVLKVCLGLSTAISVVLATQVVLFVLLFQRPVWALAALLVGQLTISGYMFSLSAELQVSIRFLWTLLALLLLIPILKNRGGIELGSGARRILIPAIIFFTLAAISNVVNTDTSNTLKYLRQSFSALSILILLPAVVNRERDIKFLSIVALVTCSISAIFAIMQHAYFRGWDVPVYYVVSGGISGGRVVGLTENPVNFSYQLPLVLLPAFGVLLLKGVDSRSRKLLGILIISMGLALYFTYTRSGIYALGIGALAIAFLLKGRIKIVMLLAMLLLAISFLLYADVRDTRYSQGFVDDQSAAGRLVLWQAGVSIALDNPTLGIGYWQFEETSLEYASEINPLYMETQGAGRVLGNLEVHNDFLRIWLSFGTPALLAFLCLLVNTFRNFLDSYRYATSLFLKSLALGCIGALAAYVVSASTHNVMDSVFLLWILGGLSIAITKLLISGQSPIKQES